MEISWSSLLTSIFSARAARATLPRVSRNAMRMCCGINGSLSGSSLVVGVVAVIAFVKQRKEGFVFIIVNVQYRNFAALFGHCPRTQGSSRIHVSVSEAVGQVASLVQCPGDRTDCSARESSLSRCTQTSVRR